MPDWKRHQHGAAGAPPCSTDIQKEERVKNRGGCAWNTKVASEVCVSLGRNMGNRYSWGLRAWPIWDGRARKIFLSRGRVPQLHSCGLLTPCFVLPLDVCHQPWGLWQAGKDSRVRNTLISMELFPKDTMQHIDPLLPHINLGKICFYLILYFLTGKFSPLFSENVPETSFFQPSTERLENE